MKDNMSLEIQRKESNQKKKEGILLLKDKQKNISRDILSFISLFQTGVNELQCSQCANRITRNDVVEHCKEHIMDLNNEIEKLSNENTLIEDDNYDDKVLENLGVETPAITFKTEPVFDDVETRNGLKVEKQSVKENVKEIDLQCEICSSTFKTESELLKHCTIVHCLSGLERLYVDYVDGNACKLCNKDLPSDLSLQMHLGIMHMKTNDILVECGLKPVSSHVNQDAEAKRKRTNGHLKCQICEYKSKHKQNLERHYSIKHFSEEMRTICSQVSKDLKCALCDHIAKRQVDMASHIGMQHGYINKILKANGYTIIQKKKRSRKIKKQLINKSKEKKRQTPLTKESNILENILDTLSHGGEIESKTPKIKESKSRQETR